MSEEKYQRDIEGVEDDSEASEVDPAIHWETKQRDLVTGTVDYNLSALADLITDRSIDLSPEYQRRFRWDDLKQSKLIESFLMNVPVPPIFLREKSAIYKEMRDAELVLRYLAFRDGWESFSGGIKQHLDSYMDENAEMSPEQLAEAQNDFLSTLNVVEACFGDYAFRRWVPERNLWRQQVLASLYDAQMFACRGLSMRIALQKQGEIISSLKDLFQDKEFRKSIDASTNTPIYFRTRISKLKDILQRVTKSEW